jgi:hypothetical protein
MSAKDMSALATRIANHAWRKDGEPEYDRSEPTSVGYEHYRQRAVSVLQSLDELGFTINYPARKATGNAAHPEAKEGNHG